MLWESLLDAGGEWDRDFKDLGAQGLRGEGQTEPASSGTRNK